MSVTVTEAQIAAALEAGEEAALKSHIALTDFCRLVRILTRSLRESRDENAKLAARVAELSQK